MKHFLLQGSIWVMSIFSAVAAPIAVPKALDRESAGFRTKPAILTPVLGDYPNVSLPLSTDTMVMPNAVPFNTTSIQVSTSTNFNGTLEGSPITGVVRVTDAHPAGMHTVTVRAFDGGGASAAKTFILTVTTPTTCNPVSFTPVANLATGNGSFAVAVGDFNGDGRQDLAVANYASPGGVSIFLGNGAGGFIGPTGFSVGNLPFSVAVGDFNGDGKQDVVVASGNFGGSNNVGILLGNGNGTFNAATYFIADDGPISVAVGDFNGDGKQDLAVVNTSSGNVSILLGNGAGHFSAPTNFAAGAGPYSVTVGDFNNDGKQDLAIAHSIVPGRVSVLLGDGAGNFAAPVHFATGSGSYAVAVGDFNGDGNQDLAVTNYFSNNVSILLGDGTGNFSGPANFAAGNTPWPAAVGDFDGDNIQDLAIGNVNSNKISILLGDGMGDFRAPVYFNVGNFPQSVAVGDFNGDGMQDLVTANDSASTMSILLRDCALTPTSVVSRKTHGAAGTFDIDLPLTGSPGIECRTDGGSIRDYTVVLTFSGNVTVTGSPQAEVTLGTGAIGSGGLGNGGAVTIDGNSVTIPLTNVANAQIINVTLFGVNGLGDVIIPMGILAGDINANGVVNASDVAQTKLRVGQPIDTTTFKSDVTTNGSINATDVIFIKSKIGTGLP